MRALEPDPPADAPAVLAAVLALHDAADPAALAANLPRLIGDLIPWDSCDLVGELAVRLGAPAPSDAAHRLAVRTPGGGRLLLGVVLGRRRPFTPRETATGALLGPHVGAAVDHARLRATTRTAPASPSLPALTVRERQVLALVADGGRDRDIATALHIEPRTVEKHVEHIRAKLGARNRAEAVARWARASV